MKGTLKTVFITLLIFFGHKPPLQAQNQCNCSESFEELYSYIEQEYPGWKHKVNPKTENAFAKLTVDTRKLVKNGDNAMCTFAVQKWVAFFDDGHLQVIYNIPPAETLPESIRISEAATKGLYKKYNHSSIEGIWTSEDESYKIAVIKAKNSIYSNAFQGIVLESKNINFKPGMVKFEIANNGTDVLYYFADLSSGYHSLKRTEKNELMFSNRSNVFTRKKNGNSVSSITSTNNSSDFNYKILDSETVVVSIPTFLQDYDSTMVKFFDAVKPFISSHKNLIIDLRGNGGGGNPVWLPFQPYIYTNPIKFESQVAYLAPENSKFWLIEEGWIDNIDTTTAFYKSEAIQKVLPRATENSKLIKSKMGSSDFVELENGIYEQDSIYKYPEKVAIIVDRSGASQTETVCIETKQSTKVTTYGEPTDGTVDYIIIRERNLSCNLFSLMLPIGHRPNLQENALDKTGFIPDILIPEDTPDWIEFVRKAMK